MKTDYFLRLKTSINLHLFLITMLMASFSIDVISQTFGTPPVGWKSVTHMRDPLENLPSSRDLSGEDWWYNVIKMYDASENHIGYIAVGYSNFDDYIYEETQGCIAGEYERICVDFHVTDTVSLLDTDVEKAGTTFQSIGIFNLAGKMIRCRVINIGNFWGVTQSEDRQSIIAVGNTTATEDFRSNEWDSQDDGWLIYNPDANNHPNSTSQETLENCSTPDTNGGKVNVVKLTNDLDVEWNYLYGARDFSVGLTDILASDGIGFSIATIPSSPEEYVIAGRSKILATPASSAYVLRVDQNGYKIWDDSPIEADTISTLLDVVRNSSGELYVTGYKNTSDTNNNKSKLYLACYTSTGTSPIWEKEYGNGFDSDIDENLGNVGFDLSFTTDGKLLLAGLVASHESTEGTNEITNTARNPVVFNFCRAEGKVYTFDASINPAVGGLEARDPISIGIVKTYDLKIGVTGTSDGGMAVVSTKINDVFPNNSSRQYWSYFDFTSAHPNIYIPNETVGDACGAADYYMHNYDADGYVAKYHLSGGEWVQTWEQTFDTDEPRANFPGQIKKQECLYKIVEADDGGLIVAGNTSHNHDDNYLVRIHEPCFSNEANNPSYPWDIPTSFSANWTSSGDVYTLQSNETWTGQNYEIKGTLVIKDGTKLIIRNSTIEFTDTRKSGVPTKIIVERGGELVVRNSTLTVSDQCPYGLWDGITVLGDPYSQVASEQGKVYVHDNSIIEHSRTAIFVGSTELVFKYKYQGGGIVQTNNATFRQNRFGITIHPHYASQNGTFNNPSYITNTLFTNTGPINDIAAVATVNGVSHRVGSANHIQMWGVDGIVIGGCTLQGTTQVNAEVWAQGIYSIDATYEVKNTIFEKLKRGMEVKASDPLSAPLIEECTFSEWYQSGIFMANVTSADIYNNDFDATDIPSSKPGLYLYNCDAYQVMKNEFFSTGESAGGKGLEVYNTSPAIDANSDNLIYDNSFDNLTFASFGGGQNDGDGLLSTDKGLDFKCNEYTDNTYDILTTIGPGISPAQGFDDLNDDPNSPAGNIFDGCVSSLGELYNSENFYNYYHHKELTDPDRVPNSTCYNTNDVDLEDTDIEVTELGTCPTIFERGSGRVSFANEGLEDAESAYDSYFTTYNNTIDGGDKQDLLDAIADDDTPAQIATLFDPIAPYLSDEVMIALIDDKATPMPSSDLVDILIDNSPLTQTVLDAVDNRTPAIAGSDATDLNNAQSGASAREVMEQQLAYYAHEEQQWRQEYIRALIHNYELADGQRMNKLRTALADEDSPRAQAQIVSTYLHEGDESNAASANSDLSAYGNEWDDLVDLFDLKRQWLIDSVWLDTLLHDETMMSDIEGWATTEDSPAFLAAGSILEFIDENLREKPDLVPNYDILEDHVPPTISSSKRGFDVIAEEDSEDEIEVSDFIAYPNPFDGSISFTTSGEAGVISIYDIRGVLIDQFNVQAESSIVTYDGNQLTNGLYFASFKTPSSTLKTIRIVKQ